MGWPAASHAGCRLYRLCLPPGEAAYRCLRKTGRTAGRKLWAGRGHDNLTPGVAGSSRVWPIGFRLDSTGADAQVCRGTLVGRKNRQKKPLVSGASNGLVSRRVFLQAPGNGSVPQRHLCVQTRLSQFLIQVAAGRSKFMEIAASAEDGNYSDPGPLMPVSASYLCLRIQPSRPSAPGRIESPLHPHPEDGKDVHQLLPATDGILVHPRPYYAAGPAGLPPLPGSDHHLPT